MFVHFAFTVHYILVPPSVTHRGGNGTQPLTEGSSMHRKRGEHAALALTVLIKALIYKLYITLSVVRHTSLNFIPCIKILKS